MRKKSILCIEGHWDKGFRNQRSIKKALEYLEESTGIKSNYQTATTCDQLFEHIKEASLKRNDIFKIVYLACHGDKGVIDLSHKNQITLEDIAESCKDRLSGKLIHFGCCSTLNISDKKLLSFLEYTGANAISGYSKKIDFNEGTFFDMLLFDKYQYTESVKTLDRQMAKLHGEFSKRLGFKIVTKQVKNRLKA